jgi:ATP-grasp domain-containing protein
MLVVLSEDSFVDPNTINGRELRATVDAARMFGCRIYPMPPNFEECGTAENALVYLPDFDPPVAGIVAGYIPAPDHYSAVYEAAAAKGVRLVNTPAQFQTAMEFDKFYPLLGELTPESVVVSSVEELFDSGNRLPFPVFVKGAIKSNKDQGWAACVAYNDGELESIAKDLFARERRSRGRIIIRRLVKFRTLATDQQGFPIGREYRVFMYRDQLLALAFYWDEYRDSTVLTDADRSAIRTLSMEASRRVGTPYIALDVGQLEDGRWIVIEVSDGQFAGLSHVGLFELWSKLAEIRI